MIKLIINREIIIQYDNNTEIKQNHRCIENKEKYLFFNIIYKYNLV